MIVIGGKLQYSEKPFSQCHFVHHEFHMDWPGTDRAPPQWEAWDTARQWRLNCVDVLYTMPDVKENTVLVHYKVQSANAVWGCNCAFRIIVNTCMHHVVEHRLSSCHSRWYILLPLGAKWLIHGYGHQYKHEGFIAWIKLSSLRISLLIGNMEIVTLWCPGFHEQINGCNLYTGSALSAGFNCSCSITPPGTHCFTEIHVIFCVFILCTERCFSL
jgi:hypothetical protein